MLEPESRFSVKLSPHNTLDEMRGREDWLDGQSAEHLRDYEVYFLGGSDLWIFYDPVLAAAFRLRFS